MRGIQKTAEGKRSFIQKSWHLEIERNLSITKQQWTWNARRKSHRALYQPPTFTLFLMSRCCVESCGAHRPARPARDKLWSADGTSADPLGSLFVPLFFQGILRIVFPSLVFCELDLYVFVIEHRSFWFDLSTIHCRCISYFIALWTKPNRTIQFVEVLIYHSIGGI